MAAARLGRLRPLHGHSVSSLPLRHRLHRARSAESSPPTGHSTRTGRPQVRVRLGDGVRCDPPVVLADATSVLDPSLKTQDEPLILMWCCCQQRFKINFIFSVHSTHSWKNIEGNSVFQMLILNYGCKMRSSRNLSLKLYDL
jgi:hypothetical protein